jgi:hypothetical protein
VRAAASVHAGARANVSLDWITLTAPALGPGRMNKVHGDSKFA